jgi:hypothetical protein
MIPQDQLDSMIERMKEINSHRKGHATIAEFWYELFKDKYVEVYLGDAYETVSTEQVSTPYPTIFFGKVIAAYKECLVIEGAYIDRRNNVSKMGKQIFISERSVRGLCEVDGNGIIDDIFLRSREAFLLKELANKK